MNNVIYILWSGMHFNKDATVTLLTHGVVICYTPYKLNTRHGHKHHYQSSLKGFLPPAFPEPFLVRMLAPLAI